MDLRNFETTTTYAIEAVYSEYWRMIPERFRLTERAQIQPKEHHHKQGPLKYSDVEEQGMPKKEPVDFYEEYCRVMNSGKRFDLMPFFDPQLDFENRLHYKLVDISFPEREKPWFIITWNFGQGILNSSLTRRRFQSAADETPAGDKVTFDFIDSDMNLNFAIYSNHLQALFELNENIIISQREKKCVETNTHSILGKFPVALNKIEAGITKLPREKGTLCCMNLNVSIDYPIIGNVRDANTGIIKEFHLELDDNTYTEFSEGFTLFEKDVSQHEVLSRDIVSENTPDFHVGNQFTFKLK